MNRVVKSPESRTAPPGGQEGKSATTSRRAELIGKLTTRFRRESIDVSQNAPPGSEDLTTTTAPRPRRPRSSRAAQVTAAIATAGVTVGSVAACGKEKVNVTPVNNAPKASAKPNAPKSETIDLSKPVVVKQVCALATSAEVYAIFNKEAGQYDGCDDSTGPDNDPDLLLAGTWSGGDSSQVDSVEVYLDKAGARGQEIMRESQPVSFNGVNAGWSPAGGTLTIPLVASGNKTLTVWTDSMDTRVSYDDRLQRSEELAKLLLQRATGVEQPPVQGDVNAPAPSENPALQSPEPETPPTQPYPSISGYQPRVE